QHRALPDARIMENAGMLAADLMFTAAARPELISDYVVFPPHTDELRYPAPGAPALAEQVTALLDGHGLAARIDRQRGFDHGMFIPLKLVFPEADKIGRASCRERV